MAGTLVLEVYRGEEEGWKILNTETYDDSDYEKVLKTMKMKKNHVGQELLFWSSNENRQSSFCRECFDPRNSWVATP